MTKKISRKQFLKSSFGTMAGLFLADSYTKSGFAQTPNITVLENLKPGTTDWLPDNPARNREIEGYASRTSVNRGGAINFYISCVEPVYTIEIFRLGWYGGTGARRVSGPVNGIGTRQTMPKAQSGTGLIECNWRTSYSLSIPNSTDPTDWCSGIYLVKLTARNSKLESYIPFVVRDDKRPASLLFQQSVTTYQAYNNWGGKSLYYYNSNGAPAYKVSFNRPYAEGYGTGDALGWELNMLRFLEREGYDVTYCTNIDTHEQPNLLRSHKAFLSVGHDEYWSWQMRQNVTAARDNAVNLGFFSANSCYWQIRLEPGGKTLSPNRTMVCYKDDFVRDPVFNDAQNRHLTSTLWRNDPVNLPEDALIGVMYEYNPVQADIVIENADYWVFNGTGLSNGGRLPGLLGYEVDRIYGNAPGNLVSLASSPYQTDTGTHFSNMTLYYWMGAMVFATGSIQWAWGLDSYGAGSEHPNYVHPAAQQITRNILHSFGA